MANYTLADVKALREETGAGMMDVKNALVEADGDKAAALKIIRLKGLKSLSKREGRDAAAGLIVAAVNEDATTGVMVEINSETDFVAKNEKFIAFAGEILDAAVASGATTLEELLAAPLGEGTVQDRVNDMGATVGEKTEIGRIARVSGDYVDLYLHQTNPDLPAQVGVLVVTDTAGKELARDIAMHIAAYRPRWISRHVVPEEILENERQTLTEITIKEGKPAHIAPRIVEGRMNSFFKENALVDQDFARDATVTVGKVLEDNGAEVTEFVLFQVGA